MERRSLFSSLKTSIETTIESALDLAFLNHFCLGVHLQYRVIKAFPVAFYPRKEYTDWNCLGLFELAPLYKDSVFQELTAV